MLTIRLARVGHKGQASFRLVAADKRRHVQAKFVEILGHYNPHSKEFVVNEEQLNKHLQNGAQPSSTVVKLLKRQKIKLPKWAEANLIVKKKAPKTKKGEVEATQAPKAEVVPAVEATEEAPVEEVKAEPKPSDKSEDPAPSDEKSKIEPAKPDKPPKTSKTAPEPAKTDSTK